MLKNLQAELNAFGKYVVQQSRSNLTKQKRNATKNLYNSIHYNLDKDKGNYDLDFIYKNAKLINAKSTRPIRVNADSNFDIQADGLVNFKALGSIAFDLVKDAFANKPINIKVNGSVKVKFIGFVQTVEIQGDEFIVSQNLLEDLSLDDDVDKGKAKVNKIIGFLGLKI